jgi:hypothetical protein
MADGQVLKENAGICQMVKQLFFATVLALSRSFPNSRLSTSEALMIKARKVPCLLSIRRSGDTHLIFGL